MPGVLDFDQPPGTTDWDPGKAPGIYRGDTWVHPLSFVDPEGDPFPIAGTLTAQLRSSDLSGPDAEEPLADVSVTVDGAQVVLTLPSEVTVGLPDRWVWDLQQVADGVTTTLLRGKGRTFNDVTRPNQ